MGTFGFVSSHRPSLACVGGALCREFCENYSVFSCLFRLSLRVLLWVGYSLGSTAFVSPGLLLCPRPLFHGGALRIYVDLIEVDYGRVRVTTRTISFFPSEERPGKH